MNHTPTPWEVGGPYPGTSVIYCVGGEPPRYEAICWLDQRTEGEPDAQSRADAAFIVRACNNFDDLLAACKAALTWIADRLDEDDGMPLAAQSLDAAIAKAETP